MRINLAYVAPKATAGQEDGVRVPRNPGQSHQRRELVSDWLDEQDNDPNENDPHRESQNNRKCYTVVLRWLLVANNPTGCRLRPTIDLSTHTIMTASGQSLPLDFT